MLQDNKYEPLVLNKTYKVYKSLYSIINNLPKKSRYTIGAKIENNLLSLIEKIIEANIQIINLREPILHSALAKCETLKILLRLAHDIKAINEKVYITYENNLLEISKMLGGWIKYLRTK